jgi:hypothetical protein
VQADAGLAEEEGHGKLLSANAIPDRPSREALGLSALLN